MSVDRVSRSRATVLHCIPSMGGGGAERQLTYLAAALGPFGWTVHVAVARRGPNWDRLVDSGAIVHELPLRGAYDWRAVGALRRVVAEVHPDIMQVWLLQMEVLGGAAALASRTPWVFSERASAPAYPLTVKNLVRRRIGTLATAVVSNSAAGDAYWHGHASRRFVVPNGIPLTEIDETPSASADAMRRQAGRPVVLFAGRLEPQKNIRILLAAFDLVLARHDVQVVVCGEGSLRSQADAWAARAAGHGASVRGYDPDLWAAMKGAAVLVSPALFEGSPNVVLEGMACGVPLVVSDIPEHRELLDESAALLVPPHSAPALADAIETVVRDPDAASRRARVARERAARYSLSNVARRYDDVYRQLLAARGRS